jgi:hypothetical protein
MINALAAAGYSFSEQDVIGFGSAPAFQLLEGEFPFIAARTPTMREDFYRTAGVDWSATVPADGESIWKGPFEALSRGDAVMLRVDMRFLPYLFGGAYGPDYMSFGWHWICLFGVDFDAGTAIVSDTGLEGPRVIKLDDLERARTSDTRVWPPRAEYSTVKRAPEGFGFDVDGRESAVRASLAATLASYSGERSLDPGAASGLAALEAFPAKVAALEATLSKWTASPALAYMGDTIERNGSGGAAFRKLYALFLRDQAAALSGRPIGAALFAAADSCDAAVSAWEALAAAFMEASSAAAKGDARAALDKAAAAARRVYEAERSLAESLERALR